MLKDLRPYTAAILLITLLAQGCAAPGRVVQYLLRDEDQAAVYYRNYATSLDYPSPADEDHQTDADLFVAPRSVTSLDDVEERSITLEECLRMALSNSAIVREDTSFLSPANPLLANPERVPSVFDNAIQETGFLIGNRGAEAALSDFDPVLSSNLQAGRSEDVQNTANIGLNQGDVLQENSGQWITRLEKSFAHSGSFAVESNWSYSRNNQSRLFDSAYNAFLQAEYRQPLLAASGTEFTRIAGPASQTLRGVSGVSQGVLISRINSDISLLDFEQSVQSMVRDVESLYWDLYLALHLYHSEVMTFKDIVKYSDLLATRLEARDTVYQAQNRLYEADARIKGSLADVLQAESRLRRLLGLPLNDGKFLVPVDQPQEARFMPNWEATLMDALSHRTEIRRQKWQVRSLQLQLRAAQNLNRPRLDLVTQYRVNGFGDSIYNGGNDDDSLTDEGYAGALESLAQGNQSGWAAGVQFSLPLGLRIARAQVRNYELRLRKAKRVLHFQEEEISRELNHAQLEMERWYLLAETGAKRADVAVNYAETAEERVASDNARDPSSIGRVLDAKITSRDADQSYLRSIVEYNKAIAEMHFRSGTLLRENSIKLAEGEWNDEAYHQALERGDAISNGLDNDHLTTVPAEFSGGPAPNSWEATGSFNRPHRPGAVDEAFGSEGADETMGDAAVPGDSDATGAADNTGDTESAVAAAGTSNQSGKLQSEDAVLFDDVNGASSRKQPVPNVPRKAAPANKPATVVPSRPVVPAVPDAATLKQARKQYLQPAKPVSSGSATQSTTNQAKHGGRVFLDDSLPTGNTAETDTAGRVRL